jgi:hypothetical protein
VFAGKLQLRRYARPKTGHLRVVNSHFSGFASLALEVFLSNTLKIISFLAETK